MSIDDTQVDQEFECDTVEDAVADLRAGKMIVVLDDEDRENEGDIVCAAETITPAQVNFIIKEARGLLWCSHVLGTPEEAGAGSHGPREHRPHGDLVHGVGGLQAGNHHRDQRPGSGRHHPRPGQRPHPSR